MMENLRRYITLVCCLLIGAALSAQTSEEDRVFIVYDASNGLADNRAEVVMSTKTGRMMVSTLGHVNFFDGSMFRHIDPKMSDAHPLPGYEGRYQVTFDRMHHLWVKHDRMMTCLNLTTETFVSDVPAEIRAMGIKGQVDDIYGDGNSNAWFRTGRKIYCPALKKSFQIHCDATLQEVEVYRDSLLLMFHADCSVVVYDYRTGRMLRHDYAFDDEERTHYSNFSEACLMNHHYFQIRSSEEEAVLLTYDLYTNRWDVVLRRPFNMKALCPHGDVLYIGTARGYMTYHSRTGEFHHYEQLRLSKGRTMVPDITSIAFDRQGGMWLGTERRGLLFCKAYKSPFSVYELNTPEAQHYVQLLDRNLKKPEQPLPRKVNCVFTDSRGWQWTGSYLGLELQRPDGSTEVFDSHNGLTNDVVHSIAEDTNHDIWVSTSYGIAHLFLRGGKVIHLEPYINQDNVPNEMYLNGRAVTLPDGTIVMQSIDHVTVFNPSKFHARMFGNIAMNPKLVHLMVNGNSIKAGTKVDDRVITEKAVARTGEIYLDYDQNSLSMTFSALNYLRPIQTYYRLRIKGVHGFNDWRVYSYGKSEGMVNKYGLLHLQMPELAPGSYVIELQSSMWPETWSQEPYRWTVHVLQPWWRTTGIYISLGVLVLLFIVLNIVLYTRNMSVRMNLNNQEYELLRHVKTFANRCKSLEGEQKPDAANDALDAAAAAALNADFVKVMQRIVPYVNSHNQLTLTMDELEEAAGMDRMRLYDLLSDNIDKSPRLYLAALRKTHA